MSVYGRPWNSLATCPECTLPSVAEKITATPWSQRGFRKLMGGWMSYEGFCEAEYLLALAPHTHVFVLLKITVRDETVSTWHVERQGRTKTLTDRKRIDLTTALVWQTMCVCNKRVDHVSGSSRSGHEEQMWKNITPAGSDFFCFMDSLEVLVLFKKKRKSWRPQSSGSMKREEKTNGADRYWETDSATSDFYLR